MNGLDHSLFHFINSTLSNALLDWLCPLFREKLFWAPLYLFLVAFVLLNFGKKRWLVLLGVAISLLLADQISSHVIKPITQRERPCREAIFAETVRLRVDQCGGGYSFPSSHAANHFAVAVFVAGVLGWRRRVTLGLGIWAAAIAFSQVYVGLHFPGDVFFGAILGGATGWLVWQFFEKKLGLGGSYQDDKSLKINE